MFDPAAGWQGLKDFLAGLSLDNYAMLVFRSDLSDVLSPQPADRGDLDAMLLLIGYPIAYGIARAPRRAQPILVMLVVLPF